MRTLEIEVPGRPGVRLAAEVHHEDSAATVLVAAGLGLPARIWHPVVDALPEVCLVLVDRPGIGGRVPATAAPGGLADQVDVLRLALEVARPGAGPVIVVGHSYGALLAEAFALRLPDRTAALVLVDPSVAADEARGWQLEGRLSQLLGAVVRRPLPAALVGWAVGPLTVGIGTCRPARGDVARDVRATFRGAAHLGATLRELASIRGDAMELLAARSRRRLPPVPVRLVVGARHGWPLRWVRRPRGRWLRRMRALAGEFAPAVVVTEAEGAHLLMLDAPDGVAAAIRSAAAAAQPPSAPGPV